MPEKPCRVLALKSTSKRTLIQLANSPQAKKRSKQNERRRRHNSSQRSMVRTYLKKVDAAIEGGNIKHASEAFSAAVPVIDRMADKGVIHKNKAARHKSRMNAKIKALGENN
jgi:small subunit ribosomal protein S20